MAIESQSRRRDFLRTSLENSLHVVCCSLEELAHTSVEDAIPCEESRLVFALEQEHRVVLCVARGDHSFNRMATVEGHNLSVCHLVSRHEYTFVLPAYDFNTKPLLSESIVVTSVIVVLMGRQDSLGSSLNVPIFESVHSHFKITWVHKKLEVLGTVCQLAEDDVAKVVVEVRHW